MTNSILEITENEYLIKLNRRNFDLSFIRSLLKIVEVSKPAAKNDNEEDGDINDYSEQPIPNRHIEPDINSSAEPEYYSKLDEK